VRAAILALVCGCGRIGFDPAVTADAGASYEGDILFVERFDDNDFVSRGWYDGPGGTIDTTEHAPGSPSSLACPIAMGANSCMQGGPRRHLFAATDALYFSFWVKGLAPGTDLSIAHWIDAADDAVIGPFSSQLTVVFGVGADGAALVVVSDSANVDRSCVELTSGAIVGCNGDFSTYPFTEARAIAGCNGVPAQFPSVSCYSDSGAYVNQAVGASAATPFDAGWHFVEGYLKMSSVGAGAGVADGKIRFWVDGALAFTSDAVLFRTAARPALEWGQLFFLPYAPQAAPTATTMWLDDLVVARGR
jgi:hypothetical protein